MEALVIFILQPLFFAYYDLLEYFLGGKRLQKWQEYTLKISCLIVFLISCFLVLIGAFWVMDVEPYKTYGLIFLIVGGVILLTHFIIGVFMGINRLKKEKKKQEILFYESITENEPTPRIYYVDTNCSNDDC